MSSSKKSSTSKVGAAPTAEASNLVESMKSAGLVPVVVTTALPSGRSGVFFGYADPLDAQSGGERVVIQQARNVFYWAENNGGVLALAVEGPRSGSKVGAMVPKLLLRHVSAIVHCTDAAALAFGDASWES